MRVRAICGCKPRRDTDCHEERLRFALGLGTGAIPTVSGKFQDAHLQ